MALEPFVIRLVVDALARDQVVGEVQHVASGTSAPIRDVAELVAFLRAMATADVTIAETPQTLTSD